MSAATDFPDDDDAALEVWHRDTAQFIVAYTTAHANGNRPAVMSLVGEYGQLGSQAKMVILHGYANLLIQTAKQLDTPIDEWLVTLGFVAAGVPLNVARRHQSFRDRVASIVNNDALSGEMKMLAITRLVEGAE